MKRLRVLAAVAGMLCMCGVAEAQRGNRNNEENFNNNNNNNRQQRNRGGGFNDFGGGRGRGRFNNFNNSNIQVAEGDYSIIANKSIFLRDRRDREVIPGRVAIDPATLPPEQLLVVTGVVFEEGGFHAYVEHLLQGGLTRLTVGNQIARGVVDEIRMDGFMYKQEGQEPKFIGVAYNLEGTRVPTVQGERMRLQSLTTGGGGGEPVQAVTGFQPNFGNNQFGRGTGGLTGAQQFNDGGGRGRGNRGNNGGGGGVFGAGNAMPTVPPPPLPSDPSMSLEERMRMRRMQEGQPGAPVVIAPPVVEEAVAEEPAAQPAAAPGTSVDVDSLTNLTLEERMRLRRQQELGQ